MTKILKLYSFVDTSLMKYISQVFQHIIIRDFAKKVNGNIIYFSGEDLIDPSSLTNLKLKIKDLKNVDGIIFFTINQLNINGNFNFEITSKLLRKKIKLFFAKEKLILKSKNDLKNCLNAIYIHNNLNNDFETKLLNTY